MHSLVFIAHSPLFALRLQAGEIRCTAYLQTVTYAFPQLQPVLDAAVVSALGQNTLAAVKISACSGYPYIADNGNSPH